MPISGGGASIIGYDQMENGVGRAIHNISADGPYTVFMSMAANVVAGQVDTNSNYDIFLHDGQTNATVLVSHKAGSLATAGNAESGSPAISADGRYVTFASKATDMSRGWQNRRPGLQTSTFSTA